MKRMSMAFRLIPLLGIPVLLFAQRQAAEGVRRGLTLCAEALVPALFPVSVLSQCLLLTVDRQGLERIANPLMGRLFGLPGRCAPPVFLGLLGGFPLGAILTGRMLQNGSLSKSEAEQTALLCNNAGPGFLIGAVGAGALGRAEYGLLLILIQFLAVILTGGLLQNDALRELPLCGSEQPKWDFLSALPLAITESSGAMLRMTGSVAFFCSLTACLQAILPLRRLPALWQAGIFGCLELSGGIALLTNAEPGISFLLCAFLCGWGGLCVHLQAAEAFCRVGIPIRPYLMAKLLQALIALALGFGISPLLWRQALAESLAAVGIGSLPLFLLILKKSRWHSTKSVL